ncbi:MAG: hypothetical protein PWP35_309 [Bacteroidales bacterium]|jgi:hypothetical protein|nr:hypothetical protein [Bacteroidales bacterium]
MADDGQKKFQIEVHKTDMVNKILLYLKAKNE